MNSRSGLPIYRLQTIAKLSRGLLMALLLAWTLLATAWAILNFAILPRIDEWRPWLEARAAHVLGVRVSLNEIRAHADGLVPSLEIRDLRLQDANGRETLHLAKVMVALSPRSLWRGGFEQLYIDQPTLEIRRTRDGQIQVAGVTLGRAESGDVAVRDWLFSQLEWVVHQAQIEWVDEQREQAGAQVFQAVDAVVRNRGRHHDFRVDFTPPPGWGAPATWVAKFQHPLLSLHPGRWEQWEGDMFMDLPAFDLETIRAHVPDVSSGGAGAGMLRAWATFRQGAWSHVTADVSLRSFNLPGLFELAPTDAFGALSLDGRVVVQRTAQSLDVKTQGLQVQAAQGTLWSQGDVHWVRTQSQAAAQVFEHRLELAQLDLAALSRLIQPWAGRTAWHKWFDPALQGQATRLQLNWATDADGPRLLQAKGQIRQLQWRTADWGGVRGADLDFDVDGSQGKVGVHMQSGAVGVPVLDEPEIPVDQFSGQFSWRQANQQLLIEATDLRFANADAQGSGAIKWKSNRDIHDPLPDLGHLDLQLGLTRADLGKLHRYLPRQVPREVRDYLRVAIQKGMASGVKARVRGDLAQWPFLNPKEGEFRVAATVHEGAMALAPAYLLPVKSRPWPQLHQMSLDVVLDPRGLHFRNVRARVQGSSSVLLSGAQVDVLGWLELPDIQASLGIQGSLQDMLGALVNSTPVREMTDEFFLTTQASGNADARIQLKLPLSEVDRVQVTGRVGLGSNDIWLSPEWPRMSRVRGVVHFSENGFALGGVTGQMLGGDVRADGGSVSLPGGKTGLPGLRVQGLATAEGLRQFFRTMASTEFPRVFSGSTTYQLQAIWKQGQPELTLSSSLQGLGIDLPAPMFKPPEQARPLRVSRWSTVKRADLVEQTWSLDWERVLMARWAHAAGSGGSGRGWVRLGGSSAGPGSFDESGLPAAGWTLDVRTPLLDVDAWQAVWGTMALDGSQANPVTATRHASSSVRGGLDGPRAITVQSDLLRLSGRELHQVALQANRDAGGWKARMEAQELKGQLDYRQPEGGATASGKLTARLSRLSLGGSTTQDVESLLDESPAQIPALDIVVDEFDLRGKKLGRLEVDAVNRDAESGDGAVREWRLRKLNISNPDATFSASGNWAKVADSSRGLKRTAMSFHMNIADAGAFLGRLGMRDVIRHGKGQMDGQVSWVGSPLALDTGSLAGSLNINVENGQFLKADPGIAKLLGVLSLQSLPRRLALDFRDVFSEGFAFDFVRGDVNIEQGMARTNNLQMKGVNAAVLMEGRADIGKETQDLRVLVVPEINAGTASLIAAWVNPAVGLSSFLWQLFLRRPLIESATQAFQISGAWADPQIVRLQEFSPQPAKLP